MRTNSCLSSQETSGFIAKTSITLAVIAALTTIVALSIVCDNWVKGATQINPILLKQNIINVCWQVAKWGAATTAAFSFIFILSAFAYSRKLR